MRKIFIFAALWVLGLFLVIGTGSPHRIGSNSGEGEATPLEGDGLSAVIGTGSLPSVPADELTDYKALAFIVSTEPTGEYTAMTTTAILCYTLPVGNGVYVWQGGGSSWAAFDHLHYRLTASGDATGVTAITVKQYIFGEATDTPVYVRDIVGVG